MFGMIGIINRKSAISIGQCFQKKDAPRLVWEVSSLFRGEDGHDYAHMVLQRDKTVSKTLALTALARGDQFVVLRN